MSRTPSKDLETALVEAAEAVLLRDGPTGISVRAVAQEAAVAPMGVYNRFGSKQGLLDELLLRGFTMLRDAVRDRGEADPVQRLLASGERYRRFALDQRHYYALMFGAGGSLKDFSAEVGERAQEAFGVLVEHVAHAVESGALTPTDPFERAQQIWGSIHGMVTLEMYGLVKTGEPAATYTALLQLLLRGSTVAP